jgi:hypothetical protein
LKILAATPFEASFRSPVAEVMRALEKYKWSSVPREIPGGNRSVSGIFEIFG